MSASEARAHRWRSCGAVVYTWIGSCPERYAGGMNQPRSGAQPGQTHQPSAAAERLAAVLGWEHVPELTEEQAKAADAQLEAAQADARRIYGLDEA